MDEKKKKLIEQAARKAVDKGAFSLSGEEKADELMKKSIGEFSKLSAEEQEKIRMEFLKESMPPKELLEEADADNAIIVLTTGEMENGSSFYAYLAIKPSKYLDFLEAEKKGDYKLSDYGKVIEMGEGENPSTQVMKKMEKEFGIRHDFEEEFVKALKSTIND